MKNDELKFNLKDGINTNKEMIKIFLENVYLPYTSAEIFEIFSKKFITGYASSEEFSKNSIRKELQNLSNTNIIQSRGLEGKRDNLYLANENSEINELIFDLKGYYICNMDSSNIPDGILNRKTKRASMITDPGYEEDEKLLSKDEIINGINFFMGTGLIDLYDIRKIAAISPYKRKSAKSIEGVQRPKEKKWTLSLMKNLEARLATILTSSILIFDENHPDVEILKTNIDPITKIGSWKVKIKYREHVFDDKKPGIIIDGQQRMWALEYIAIKRLFFGNKEEIYPFYGPITVIIGDFGGNDPYKMVLTRMYFLTCNSTQNLPRALKKELSSALGGEFTENLDDKKRFIANIEKFIQILNTDPESPFYKIIDYDNKMSNRDTKEPGFVGKAGIYKMLRLILKEDPFSNKKEDPDRFIIEWKRWLQIIFDYFNVIKVCFRDVWDDKDSIILKNTTIITLGLMLKHFVSSDLALASQKKRVNKIIEIFVRWKEEEDFKFGNSFEIRDLFLNKSNLLARNPKNLKILLYESYQDALAVNTEPDISELEQLKSDWETLVEEIEEIRKREGGEN